VFITFSPGWKELSFIFYFLTFCFFCDTFHATVFPPQLPTCSFISLAPFPQALFKWSTRAPLSLNQLILESLLLPSTSFLFSPPPCYSTIIPRKISPYDSALSLSDLRRGSTFTLYVGLLSNPCPFSFHSLQDILVFHETEPRTLETPPVLFPGGPKSMLPLLSFEFCLRLLHTDFRWLIV